MNDWENAVVVDPKELTNLRSGHAKLKRRTRALGLLGLGLAGLNLATGTTRLAPVKGVFVYVGLEPNTAFLRGVLALDAAGHIETDIMMRTSLAGVFAAGDIRAGSVAQLAAAAGDGATAAISAFRYLTARSSRR